MVLETEIGERNGNPLQYSCLENPRDDRAWWAAVYGVAQCQTRLKRLSSSSSSSPSFFEEILFPVRKPSGISENNDGRFIFVGSSRNYLVPHLGVN